MQMTDVKGGFELPSDFFFLVNSDILQWVWLTNIMHLVQKLVITNVFVLPPKSLSVSALFRFRFTLGITKQRAYSHFFDKNK